MKKIVVIDGQGGRIGSLIVEKIVESKIDCEIIAVGTNSTATAVMLKAGAHAGATGENPVKVNCYDADVILGPVGIISANSLAGEISPKMAKHVAKSHALKILLPINRCNNFIVGVREMPVSEMIDEAINKLLKHIGA